MQAIDYNNLELRSRTFLDFTNDPSIIDEIVGDKELFLSTLCESGRAKTFLFFAETTSDKKLAKAIEKEFAKEAAQLFPE